MAISSFEAPILQEMQKLSVPGPNVEPPTAAMFAAGIMLYPYSQALQEIVGQTSANMVRRNISVMAAVSGLRNTLTHYFYLDDVANGIDFSDQQLITPGDWRPRFARLEADFRLPSSRRSDAAKFLSHMGLYFLDACTPVKERMLPVEVLSQLTAERFPHGARMLDYGSSVMVGSLYVTNKDAIVAPAHFKSVGGDMDLTLKANKLLDEPGKIREVVCVDRFPVYNPGRGYDDPLWRYAINGLRPSERNNPIYRNDLQILKTLKEMDEITADSRSGVQFQQADFLRPTDVEAFKEQYPEPFDFIVANYVTQELSPVDQLRLYGILRGFLSENGILVLNHQAHLLNTTAKPVGMESVLPHDSYAGKLWLSESHVLDNLQADEGLQHIASSEDNRWGNIRLAAGKLVVNGVAVPVGELVQAT